MKEEIKKIMASVFSISEESVPDNIAYGIHEKWDSIHHLNLIVELESFYGVLFEPEEIQAMTDLDLIMSFVNRKKMK